MTDNKAVMQQALDTLKRVDCVDRDCDILSLSLCEAVEQSIAALREAIAQPVSLAEPDDWTNGYLSGFADGKKAAQIQEKL